MQGMDKAIKFVYEFFWNGEGTDGLFATVLKESGRGMQSDQLSQRARGNKVRNRISPFSQCGAAR